MTPERVAEAVDRWVRFYTRDLPTPLAERRIGEIRADLHDHIAHERATGTSDRRIALGLASRMVRGLAADASWRRQTIARHSTPREVMNKNAYRSAVRIAIPTVLILVLPLVAMQVSDEFDWGVFDFVAAAAFVVVAGLLLEFAAKKPAKLAYSVAAVALGVAAIVAGEADDAPGLMLFGGLLIVGTVAVALRTAQRSA